MFESELIALEAAPLSLEAGWYIATFIGPPEDLPEPGDPFPICSPDINLDLYQTGIDCLVAVDDHKITMVAPWIN